MLSPMNTKAAMVLDKKDYEEILNLPTHIVVVISPDGRILKSNTTHKKVLGWEPMDTDGLPMLDFVHELDQEMTLQKFQHLFTGEAVSINLNNRCRNKNGNYQWISWTAIAKDGLVYAMGADATNKVEEEISLKGYQTRFKTFFDQSVLPMQIYNLQGEPLAVNKAWEELFQTTVTELSGYNVLNDPQLSHAPIKKFLERGFAGESVEVPAFWYNPKANGKVGRPRWLEAWISPVKDEKGTIHEVAMILKDVTDKIETEQALIRSISERKATEEKFQIISERLSLAVKAGKIGIWEWIPNTSYFLWDETTEQIYGYASGSFPRTTEAFTEGVHPQDQDRIWQAVHQAIKNKTSFSLDHRIIRKDGVQRWVQCSGTPFYDEKGEPYHMLGTVMDITERVEAEKDQKFLSQASEILNNSLDYREILRTLCDHAVSYFCDGVIVDQLHTDGAIKRLMVVHPDDEVAKKLLKLDEDFPNRFENNPVMAPLFSGKTLFIEDADKFWETIKWSHGDAYASAMKNIGHKSSIKVRMKGRESVLGIITFFTTKTSTKELTKRHIWLSEELSYRVSMAFENALIHLASQEAIRSRDEFLSIASHELKTPLQSLTLQNQMRKRNLNKNLLEAFTPEKIGQMIDADIRHLMRINRLIDDMLDISRIRAGKLTFMKEYVEFTSFVKDVLSRFRPQLDAAGCYMTSSFCEETMTYIDIYRTEQVILNLLTNAMKYGAGKPIRVDVLKKADRIQLLVRDQGPGIKEEDTERIFERFERAISSNEVSGLGLGLYISRQIMEQNGGALFVRSEFGKGSTFIMEVPLKND